MKNMFYYLLFPYIVLMRILYRFIRTENGMTWAMCLVSYPLWSLFLFDIIQWSILVESVIVLYVTSALYVPHFFFDTNVKRRRPNGYIPIEERHH
ncbi:hypothetical protein EAT1b_2143 [Exiguobacterium sp. AT1b]|uniref:Uncharacterized protein n=1 Tax=Exiguobacterium sp. (strain ATCC BAA-1283 / AT1b) TaxID=360911 RepID=C4L1N4_EXISA|nr:hypothetical protein [Exiguobacterium sp. AT1b]ACQ71066.1 hypothetical protein EAT1b_2143 [Exiguobacterium sp. AT1b]